MSSINYIGCSAFSGADMDFVPLHCHSHYSFHAGVPSVEALAARAAALGMPSLALTDTNRMSGLIRFYLECRRLGIRPILGVELTEPGRPGESVVALAKNAEGYGDICEIITRRHLEPGSFSMEAVFSGLCPNLILLTSSLHFLKALHRPGSGPQLFGELVNHSEKTRSHSRRLEQEAGRLGVPLVVTNNSYFLHPQEWEVHRVLRAIGLNASLSLLAPEDCAPRNAFFRSAAEMHRCFPLHPEAIVNSWRIAQQCDVQLRLGEWIMPEITVPQGLTPESHLAALAREGLEQNYRGTPAYSQASQIQEEELRVIGKLGFASYFLMVKQIRSWSGRFRQGSSYRSFKDCSLMRGSAANSITFYNIGASDLDPIKYNLYFERFLNEERAAPPDADLDFGWDERDAVFDFFADRWGQDRVAVLCTFNHFHRRAAFRETAKVFGWTEAQISAYMKGAPLRSGSPQGPPGLVPPGPLRGRDASQMPGHGLASTHSSPSGGRGGLAGRPGRGTEGDPILHRILYFAEQIRGKPRFLGQHPGGVIVTNGPIRRHVACERSGGEKDRIITQVDMHSGTDELGLIKFDILGNGSISVLRDTLKQLERQGLPDPCLGDEAKVHGDPGVLGMIAQGRTRGVFYIESPAQMRLNMKADARSFEEIGITTSLIRPAGARYTKLFVERHRRSKGAPGPEWNFLHDSLKNILNETHDCLVYQEDVIKVCHRVAGLSLRRADRVRKMMNSLQEGAPGDYALVEQEFIGGCMSVSGFSLPQAREMWDRICSFRGFSFCKSHSLSLAQLSFKCAWLKHHYPAQFMAAVISNNRGFYHRSVYLNEARRFGIRIRPLHINHSTVCYEGGGGAIVPGFQHIKGLSAHTQAAIVRERQQGGPYLGLEDFLARTPAGKSETGSLIKTGAFDGFGMNRPQLLFYLEARFGKAARSRRQTLLPGTADQAAEVPDVAPYSLTVKCLHELQLLGFMLSADILSILELHPAFKDAVSCAGIGAFSGRRVKLFGWPVTGRLHTVPGRGQMKFLTLEDASGCADAVFWPEVLRRYAAALAGPGPYEIWGRVQEDWDTFSIIAERVRGVGWSPAQVDFTLASERLSQSQERWRKWEKMYASRAA